MRTFYTHDNGGRPFKVQIDGNTVTVYKDTNKDWEKEPEYTQLIHQFKIKAVHVGRSSGKAMSADHTPLSAHEFVGNSILLELPSSKCVFIGHEIYEFELANGDVVEHYFSLVGNNDVPYPVLLGKKNVYFMLDRKLLPRTAFPLKMGRLDWEDAYQRYYGDWDARKGVWVGALGDHAKKMTHARSW